MTVAAFGEHQLAWTECIPAHHLPAVVLEFARTRDIDVAALALQSGVAGWTPAARHLAPTALHRLLDLTARGIGEPDVAFLLGNEMLPGHYGAPSHALLQARDLKQALALLPRFKADLTPLLTPRLVLGRTHAVLYWVDSFGAPAQRNFLVDMHMAAVSSMCRWLGDVKLPWRFCFNRPRPKQVAHHEVHLGSDLRWGCQIDAMFIGLEWLEQPWPRGRSIGAAAAMTAIAQSPQSGPRSLLDAVYDYLVDQVRRSPTLEGTAADLGTSAATLKRHLARHATHFQAELDQARAHVALHLFHHEGLTNDQVAAHFGFHDSSSFRRSFKRWTGLTPQLLRHGLVEAAKA